MGDDKLIKMDVSVKVPASEETSRYQRQLDAVDGALRQILPDAIELAKAITALRERSLIDNDRRLVKTCDDALAGFPQAVLECMRLTGFSKAARKKTP